MSNHKYDPEDFRGMLNLSDELANFYRLHDDYAANKTQDKRLNLEKHGRDLFFTIKHRKVEGALTAAMAQEILEYIEELLDD